MLPEISIIIPTFNRSSFLGETLDSILHQSFTNWECIVVDDGSTDYTPELMEFYLEKDARFSFYRRPEEKAKGANACRNYGFEKSKGQYINWFDSDDMMHPEKLEIQLDQLKTSPYSFCVCQTIFFEENIYNALGLRFEEIVSENYFFDYLTMRIGWLTQAPVWKREFLETLDYLFDEELQAAQEWEFHLRILEKVPDYSVVIKPLVFIRKHEEGITYNKSEDARFYNYFLARLKIYRNGKLTLDERSADFLSDYLLNSFKKMIVTNNKNAIKAYRYFILPENKITTKTKISALLAILSFRVFNKGNNVLQQIKYI